MLQKSKSSSSEDQLFEIAREQHGYFTASQAVEAGFIDANHRYHVKNGNWVKEKRGIYRLTRYPHNEFEEYALWSLWSQNRKGIRQGVYSHQTALSLYELSDINPEKMHMTVPPSFRRHSEIPAVLVLHRGNVSKKEIEEREGFGVTRPVRAIVDLIIEQSVQVDIIQQAYREASKRGLIMDDDFDGYRKNPDVDRKIVECIPELK
jgi:predicted transcriptional regulator of viral defense system